MDPFDVITMLTAINNTPRPKTFLLNLLFGGRVKTFSTATVMADFTKGKRRMAPFVSPYVGGKLIEREGREARTYTPPLIQPRDVLTPERLNTRMAGESLQSALSPADRLAKEQADILDVFDQYITRREEWMAAQLLFTGAIHMVGEGVDESFSVGFSNTDTLSNADLWSASTANPIGDINTWRRTVQEKSGITPNAAVMSSDVADAFLNHPNVKDMLDVRRMEMGTINPSELPNGATYLGSLAREGMDLYEYNEWYVDDSTGLSKPMVPATYMALVPTADRNPGAQMLYGAWTEMVKKTTYEGARIPRVWSEEGPNATFIEVVSRPLPLMPDADSWFVAKVL